MRRRSSLRSWGAGLVFLLLCSMATAVNAEEYRLGPEDVLDVTVLGEPEFSTTPQQGIAVGPDGRISYPLLGTVEVRGLTISEVERLIREAVAKRVRDPVVSVRVREFRMNRIYVLGMVGTPGVYDLRPGWGVKAAIAAAGGLGNIRGKADLREALLIRDSEVMPLDLERIVVQGNPSADVLLKPGDTMVVRECLDRVAVLGEVGRPGYYELEAGDRLTDALARAGGPLPNPGQLQEVLLQKRNGEVKAVDVAALLAGRGEETNLALEAGDTIIVPEARREVAVLGCVNEPGYYTFREGARLTDAIALAGGAITDASATGGRGLTQVADLRNVMLQRRGEEPQVVDVSVLLAGHEGENPLLMPGDTVVVPGVQRRVAVLGWVNSPGYFVFGEGARVTDALAMAGGGMRDEGDLENVRLQRMNGTTQIVNIERTLRGDGEEENLLLRPGDTIVVPEARNQVLVLGQVARPGYYRLREGDTLMDIIAKAGGGIRESRMSETCVVREEEGKQVAMQVDVQSLLAGGNLASNILLQANDIVVIPRSKGLKADDLLKALLGFYYIKQL